jgi:hypothetical protein
MSEIVNLRRARKDKARAEKAAEAEANRAKNGLTKAERARLKTENEGAVRRHAGNRLEKDD